MAEEQQLSTQEILGAYQGMMQECRQLTAKIGELSLDRDEHKLVLDTMNKLEPERRAFRLVGGVLVTRTVGDVLPQISQNYEGILKIVQTLNEQLAVKDAERKAYKEKHGIMTQEEKEQILKKQARDAQQAGQHQKLVGGAR